MVLTVHEIFNCDSKYNNIIKMIINPIKTCMLRNYYMFDTPSQKPFQNSQFQT